MDPRSSQEVREAFSSSQVTLPSDPSSNWRTRLGVALLAGVAVLAQSVWTPLILGLADLTDFTQRDWIQFFRTGNRLREGLTEILYVKDFSGGTLPEFEDRFFFLYPPFMAWLTVPLGYLGPLGAYAACITTVLTTTLLATSGLLAALRTSALQRLMSFLALVGSAPWNAAVFLGHFSSILLVSPALALWAWTRRRPVLAGVSLGVLLTKPNWGLPMLVLLLAGRRWKMVAGFLACGLALVILSLPLGPQLWGDWWQTMSGYRELVAQTTPRKQFTLLATIRGFTGELGSHPLVLGIWVPLAGIFMTWTAWIWARRSREPELFPRILAVSFLAILTSNPYAYVYDVLLAIPAALVLWTVPTAWAGPTLRRWAKGVSLVAYVLCYVQLLGALGGLGSAVGLALAVWLALELVDLGMNT